MIIETRSDNGEWVADFKKHVEDGGHGALLIETQEMVDQVRVLSMGRLENAPIGSIAVAYGVEPTVWALCDRTDDLQRIAAELAARQPSLQVALQLRIVRPQDGARAIFDLPMRHDIYDTIRTVVDLPGTMQRIQTQLFRHLDSVVERLGDNPTCVYCGTRVAVGANETELRVVPDEVPFVKVTVRRKCTACANTTPTAAVIVGATDEARKRALSALHDHQLACVRTSAAVRIAADRQNPAALVAALEAALEYQADGANLEYAAHALATLVPVAPHITRRARTVLKRVPTWPRIPEDELRHCVACDVSKPSSAYTANQWRKGRRRCRECQTGSVVRDAEAHACARADADMLAAVFDELALRERTRLTDELARRNANEHTDDECVICFQSTLDSERSALHGAHWVCVMCRDDMRAHGILQCPICRESISV